MKKFLLICIAFVATAVAVYAQQLELKEVIIRSARGIEETLPQRSKVIVLNFESPAKSFSDYVIDELSGELIEGKKITVVDRRNLSAIMDEMKFQYSGYVSDESMQSIGKMLGAQAVISGSLTDVGANYRFRIRIISVETAAVQKQISLDLKKDTQVAYLLGGAAAQKEIMQEAERKKRETEREEQKLAKKQERINNAKLNTAGLSIGFTFGTPVLVGTLHGTYSPLRYLFIEAGLDLGFIYDGEKDYGLFTLDDYISLYPFAHIGLFLPFSGKSGWYIGAGCGYMYSHYTFSDGTTDSKAFALDVLTGFNILDIIDISYTFRFNTSSSGFWDMGSQKLSIGYVYRFK